MRRERPHPGAQLSLFDTIEGFRHTAFITNTRGYDIAALELRQRQRARAENVIRDAKATGLANLPFDDIVNNDVWMQLCFCANDLLARSQQIGCVGQLRRATPKTIRHRLLHVAARITPTGRRLRLDQHWPLDERTAGRHRTRPQRLRTTQRDRPVRHPQSPMKDPG